MNIVMTTSLKPRVINNHAITGRLLQPLSPRRILE